MSNKICYYFHTLARPSREGRCFSIQNKDDHTLPYKIHVLKGRELSERVDHCLIKKRSLQLTLASLSHSFKATITLAGELGLEVYAGRIGCAVVSIQSTEVTAWHRRSTKTLQTLPQLRMAITST